MGVCPSLADLQNGGVQECYATYNKDDDVRKNSSSGGIFALMAQYVLDNGGAVCGAVFDKDWSVKHILTDDVAMLPALQKSKYVQSTVYPVLPQVKQKLEQGVMVLFVGTPCQVNALALYLGKKYDNLYLVDIACHGVPSPQVWQKYIGTFDDVKTVDFRDKSTSWQNYNVSLNHSQGRYSDYYMRNSYMMMFCKNLILRPSCYNCHSKFPAKLADVTLGDYWGVENDFEQMKDDRGVSAVIVNSQKGQQLFDCIKVNAQWHKADFNNIVKYNPSLVSPFNQPEKWQACMDELVSSPSSEFENISKKYTVPSTSARIKGAVKYYFNKIIKQ